MTDNSPDLRWNPDAWAEGTDGEPEQGRWEYWADEELMLWWSESDRAAFHQERQDGAP